MKKRLVLLPIFGALALAGCSVEDLMFWKKKESNSNEQEQKQSGGDVVPDEDSGGQTTPTVHYDFPQPDASVFIQIDYEDIKDHIPEGKTYPTAAYSFTTDGYEFSATIGVGLKSAERSGGNFYNENHAMQFKKDTGTIAIKQEVEATKVTVHWFATFSSEASKYHPKVKVGDSASAISTNVSCNEGETVQGAVTGAKQMAYDSKSDSNIERDAYFYTTTYTISGHSFFSVSDSGGATYIKDIWVHH